MSAPTPGPGYYADPSIPGYVRYWNGSAWVPGTSRPEPKPGEVLTPPAAVSASQAAAGPSVAAPPPPMPTAPAPAPTPAPVPPAQRAPSVEETGPMFLDEDPQAPVAERPEERRPEPGTSWARPPAQRQGGQEGEGVKGGYGYPQGQQPGQGPGQNQGQSQGGSPAYGYPQAQRQGPGQGGGYGPQQAEGWQRQVRQLAQGDGTAPSGEAGAGHAAIPWRPPVSNNPFLLSPEQARPAAHGRRLAARLVDSLVVGTVVGAITAPLFLASLRHIQDKIDAARMTGENVQVWLIDGTTGGYLALFVTALLLAGVLYEALPTAKWGRTLGKKLFRVRVLDIDSQLTPRFVQTLRRMLVRQLLDLVLVGVVNDVWCLFDRPWGQCWHDKVARTFVAEEE